MADALIHFDNLLADARGIIESASSRAYALANVEAALMYRRMGGRVKSELLRDQRAACGKRAVEGLPKDLMRGYGATFEVKNPRRMIQFAQEFPDESTHFMALIPIKDLFKRDFQLELGARVPTNPQKRRIHNGQIRCTRLCLDR